MTTTTLRSIACIAVLNLAARTSAQSWQQTGKLLANDGAGGDLFGSCVVLAGDTALVGTSNDDSLRGSAHLFHKVSGGWRWLARLTADDGAGGDLFGAALALSDGTVLVGAPGDDSGGVAHCGSVYVFQKIEDIWTQTAKLNASDKAQYDKFGYSVALLGNTALIGAPLDDDRGMESGAAYVFQNVNGQWVEATKLTAFDGAADDEFGISVALSGNRALVGARYDLGRRGSAYVFRNTDDGWKHSAKLSASDGVANDYFGESVALSGDTALIGAHQNDERAMDAGAAYVLQKVNGVWTQTAKLTADDGATFDSFGISVALSGDTALAGAYRDGDRGDYSGSAYVFQKLSGVWTQTAKLCAGDGEAGDVFGYSVALDNETVLIGAYGDDDDGSSSGSAYVFERRASGCTGSERVTRAECRNQNAFEILKVVLAKGAAGDSFTVTLSSGESNSGTINSRGKGKAKFKRLPSGDGVATAEWGCGATAEKPYSCP